MAVATKVSKVVPVSVPAAAPSTPSATSPATTSPLVVKSVKNATPGLGVQLLTAGTAACIADCITFPLDTVKVRLQIQGEAGAQAVQYKGVFGTVLGIARHEGPNTCG